MKEQIVFLVVATIGIIIATITDLKTNEIPDAITHFMIFFGIGSYVILSLLGISNLIPVLISISIAFLISSLMYYSGQWGGGDAKLLIGLGALFPAYPSILLNKFSPILATWPFIVTLTLNLLIVGGVYSIFILIRKSIENYRDINKKHNYVKYFVVIPILLFMYSLIYSNYLLLFFSIIFLFGSITWLAHIIQKNYFVKKLEIGKLVEGDWIMKNLYKNEKLIYKIRKIGVTKKDIGQIQKHLKGTVDVKTGIAFGPAFLISFPITLYFGDLIFFMISEILGKI